MGNSSSHFLQSQALPRLQESQGNPGAPGGVDPGHAHGHVPEQGHLRDVFGARDPIQRQGTVGASIPTDINISRNLYTHDGDTRIQI